MQGLGLRSVGVDALEVIDRIADGGMKCSEGGEAHTGQLMDYVVRLDSHIYMPRKAPGEQYVRQWCGRLFGIPHLQRAYDMPQIRHLDTKLDLLMQRKRH